VADATLGRCLERGSIRPGLHAALRARWVPRLAAVECPRAGLLHLEALGFANLLHDPASRRLSGLVDYEDCVGGDPLFELTWMEYYYGERRSAQASFACARFERGYGAWPLDDGRVTLYRALPYLEKLAWLPPDGARAHAHRQALEQLARAL
jgi:aminoglycoside phosphotransferase (APT) family kinase protein